MTGHRSKERMVGVGLPWAEQPDREYDPFFDDGEEEGEDKKDDIERGDVVITFHVQLPQEGVLNKNQNKERNDRLKETFEKEQV